MASEIMDSPPYGDLPSLPPGNMSFEELEYKYNKLRKENHQLQQRILGVNELARLLQDRNELVAVLKERNKRLDVSVVRLENRCANFERQLKSQKSSSVPSAKPGQSPFIPGPSKQILQSLWQENEDLKKTVNSLQKKGSSGYLEAVKTTQLEEFIEQQKCEIDQLRKQIENLATMGEEESSSPTVPRGAVSLQANVTDTGPLKKQLIKMQQTMMGKPHAYMLPKEALQVKDRFCTLLSQQVTELQRKLNNIQSNQVDGGGAVPEKTVSAPLTGIVSDGSDNTIKQMKKELEESSRENQELMDKMSELQVEVRHLEEEKKSLEQKCTDYTLLYSGAQAELKDLHMKSGPGSGDNSPVVEDLKKKVSDLQKTMDDQVNSYTRELRNLENGLKATNIELDDSNTKLGTALSELSAMEEGKKKLEEDKKKLESELRMERGRTDKLERENKSKTIECQNRMEKISYLQDKLNRVFDEKEDLQSELSKFLDQSTQHHYERNKERHYQKPSAPLPNLVAGGAPSILSSVSHGQEEMAKDSPIGGHVMPELVTRDPTAPSKSHVSSVPASTGGGVGNTGVFTTATNTGMSGRTNLSSGPNRNPGSSMIGGHKPPGVLPLTTTTSGGARPRSPSMPPYTRPIGHTPHPSTTSIHTPSTPHVPYPAGGVGCRPTSSTSPVPTMQSSQTGPNQFGVPMPSSHMPGPRVHTNLQYPMRNNFGTPGYGHPGSGTGAGGLSHSTATGAGSFHHPTAPGSAPGYANFGRTGGGGMMGGGNVRHNVPSSSRPMPSHTAPVHSFSTRPMDGSYPGGQGGQTGLGHYSQNSWPGDMRDHTSGSTSPHHLDNQPHYGGHPQNNNTNFR